MSNEPRDLAHCTTLPIDLTLEEPLQILGVTWEGITKVAFVIQNQWYLETKQSRAKVTAEFLSKLVYGISIGDKYGDLRWILAYFPGNRIFPQGISHTLFVWVWQNLAVLGVRPMNTYSPSLVNFGLLVLGKNFWQQIYGTVFVRARWNLAVLGGSGQSKLISRISWTLVWGSSDTSPSLMHL